MLTLLFNFSYNENTRLYMKKRFLFPTILAIGSSAILPLVSCKEAETEIQMITISGEQEVIKGKKATYSADVTTSSEEIDKTVT